jgi:hypothetical protein
MIPDNYTDQIVLNVLMINEQVSMYLSEQETAAIESI